MNDGRYANDIDYEDDGKFHATRCLPLKVIMRILLFVAAAVAALSDLSAIGIWKKEQTAVPIISAVAAFRKLIMRQLSMCLTRSV